MTIKTIVLKGTKLTLPKSWRGAEVVVRRDRDTFVVQRVLEPDEAVFNEPAQKVLRRLGKRISASTIRNAVRWARSRL